MTEPTALPSRHQARHMRVPLAFVTFAAGALLIAACGSSATKASNPPANGATGSSASSGSNTSAVVKSAMTKHGQALVDARGMTLYTLTNAGKAVPCTGACAQAWPPLTVSTTNITGSSGVGGLGTTKDANGTQVTHNGLPLYRFSEDSAPGDANGEGITNFGGTWHVVAASGAAASAPAATTPDTSSSSGGGYGY
jgi:predicted lipoprotein with Yx(FWY)xxD motif